MLFAVMIIINVAITLLGVYFFDYNVDSIVNNPGVILLSFIVGIICALIFIVTYIEVFYFFVAKKQPKDSMFKHRLAKHIMLVPMSFTNRRIKVIGIENLPDNPGFSIYANHTSMMDIPLLMCSLKNYPVAFLAKKGTFKVFLLGKWARELGGVTLVRENNREGAKSIIQVIKNVKQGSTMVVFPEGTRSKDRNTLLKFKDGSFRVALKSGAPLVPITLVRPTNKWKNKWPSVRKETVIIHKPIEYNEIVTLTTSELSEKVKVIIESGL